MFMTWLTEKPSAHVAEGYDGLWWNSRAFITLIWRLALVCTRQLQLHSSAGHSVGLLLHLSLELGRQFCMRDSGSFSWNCLEWQVI